MVKLFARSLNPAKIPFRKPEILLPPKQLRKSLFEGIGYFALNERQGVFQHEIDHMDGILFIDKLEK